jgi:hypothetical protein
VPRSIGTAAIRLLEPPDEGAVRRAAERALRMLGIDHLDVLQRYWLGKMSAFTRAVQEEMVKLRENPAGGIP